MTSKTKTAKNTNPARKSGKKRTVRSRYSKKQLIEIFSRLRRQRQKPEGELDHINNFTLLVAVVLSAQATDVGVNKATKGLFAIVETPQQMLALGEEKLIDHIKSIGLYRNKAKNVILLSKMLIEEFDSQVPNERDLLMTLPGVGRKTANVVVSMAFGQPTIAVDTHIFRLGNRLGLAPGKTTDEVEEILERIIPEEFLFHAHHWLILHGRYICKARKPDCQACIIADLCKSKQKTCDVPAPIMAMEAR